MDAEVGHVLEALEHSAVRDQTLVLLSSDHGESLGEHDYFFDHGENLFDPSLRIPLVLAGPGIERGRARASSPARSTSCRPARRPEDLLPAGPRGREPARRRPRRAARTPAAAAQNDRNLLAAWDRRFKLVATPNESGSSYALFDRELDPGETRDVGPANADELREERRELELFRERIDAQLVKTRRLLEGRPEGERLSAEACERLKALGYIVPGCS